MPFSVFDHSAIPTPRIFRSLHLHFPAVNRFICLSSQRNMSPENSLLSGASTAQKSGAGKSHAAGCGVINCIDDCATSCIKLMSPSNDPEAGWLVGWLNPCFPALRLTSDCDLRLRTTYVFKISGFESSPWNWRKTAKACGSWQLHWVW